MNIFEAGKHVLVSLSWSFVRKNDTLVYPHRGRVRDVSVAGGQNGHERVVTFTVDNGHDANRFKRVSMVSGKGDRAIVRMSRHSPRKFLSWF